MRQDHFLRNATWHPVRQLRHPRERRPLATGPIEFELGERYSRRTRMGILFFLSAGSWAVVALLALAAFR